jgi:hypothetical protein
MNLHEFTIKYKDQPDLHHILDFLKANNYQSKDIRFNYAEAKIKAKKWQDQLNNIICMPEGKTKKILDLKKNGIMIVRLEDLASKQYEGFHMRHCVGSYKHHKGIYSLRDKNNKPHCTIEVENKIVKQIKGKANGFIDPVYFQFIMDFIQYSKFKLDDQFKDFSKLGFIKLEEPFLSFFTQHFKLEKILINNSSIFLSGNHKIKLIKPFTITDESIFIRLCKYPQLSPEAIDLFIHNGVNITAKSNLAIKLACDAGNIELVKKLESLGANLNDSDGISLSWAAESNRISMVKYLLNKSIQITQPHHDPLLIAIRKRHINLIKFLLDSDYQSLAGWLDVSHFVTNISLIDPELYQKLLNKFREK